MKASVVNYVQNCEVCKQTKSENNLYPGLLQPLEVPQGAWTHLSMDFIEGLPKSEGKNVILVVVDRFSKYGHFIPLSHPYTATSIAKLFLDNIVKLHGQPSSIVSDRDPIFTSVFWKELFKLMGIDLRFTSAYHPQSDGQTEWLNQCLENYLRACTNQHPHKWMNWISMAEYCYNTNYHTSLKNTPFFVLYGYKPPHFSLDPYLKSPSIEASSYIQNRAEVVQMIKENLLKAQERMKYFADLKRVDREFAVGDEVYLKLQPFRQNSVVLRHNLKLAYKYYGPYKVLEKIGKVAYRLQLPEGAKIHDVFYVSLLKKKLSPLCSPVPTLPHTDNNGALVTVPQQILNSRKLQQPKGEVQQILVKWSNLPSNHATWENLSDFQAKYPNFDPWGQGSSPGGVMSWPT